MKIRDIDFSAYEYQRIAVVKRIGPEYCAAHAEDYVRQTYGEAELCENGISCADGWLTLKLKESTKEAN